MQLLLLAVPLLLALLTLRTRSVFFKVSVALSNALIVVLCLFLLPAPHASTLIVAAALAVSAVGDYFLATRGKRVNRFIAGIAAFLLAHLGFLAFSVLNGRVVWPVFAVSAGAYAAFHFFGIRPRNPHRAFSAAVLAYMMASCLSFSAACGLALPVLPKGLFVAGIVLIMISDTCIGLREFLGYKKAKRLILPLYFLSHLSIVAALILWGLAG